MAALGGLLGAYGSDEEEEEEEEQQHGETQQTGQVTLIRDEDELGGGLDLSHLTSAAARGTEADTAAAGGAGLDGLPGGRTGPNRQQIGTGGGPMDVDAQLEGAAGGGEQPPAGADDAGAAADPMSVLPPEMQHPPEGQCDPDYQAKVANWLHTQRTKGKYINDEIRKGRGYRNPEFFAKMVEHLEIDQYGTSLAPEVYDPKALPKEDYLDALQKEWAAEEERRKAARAAGQRGVEFHKSSSQPNLVQPALKPGLNQAGQPGFAPPSAAAAAAALAAKAGVQVQTAAQIQAAQAQAVAQAQAMAHAQAHAAAQAQAAAQAAAAGQGQGGVSAVAAVAAAQAKAAQLAAQLTGIARPR